MFKAAPADYVEPMDPLLKLLREDASLQAADLARMLNLPEADVAAKINVMKPTRSSWAIARS